MRARRVDVRRERRVPFPNLGFIKINEVRRPADGRVVVEAEGASDNVRARLRSRWWWWWTCSVDGHCGRRQAGDARGERDREAGVDEQRRRAGARPRALDAQAGDAAGDAATDDAGEKMSKQSGGTLSKKQLAAGAAARAI